MTVHEWAKAFRAYQAALAHKDYWTESREVSVRRVDTAFDALVKLCEQVEK